LNSEGQLVLPKSESVGSIERIRFGSEEHDCTDEDIDVLVSRLAAIDEFVDVLVARYRILRFDSTNDTFCRGVERSEDEIRRECVMIHLHSSLDSFSQHPLERGI